MSNSSRRAGECLEGSTRLALCTLGLVELTLEGAVPAEEALLDEVDEEDGENSIGTEAGLVLRGKLEDHESDYCWYIK